MVALYVITERYQRYSFRGSVLVVLAFARFVNAQNAHVLHMFVEPNHQTTGRRKIRKKKVPVIHTFIMDNPEYPDNSVEVNLQDVITGEEFTLQLSPNSALKAKTASEHVQSTSSSNTSLKEVFDNMDMSTNEEREMEEDEIEETSLTENKENFRWSHAAIMLLLEEYRLRESSMSSGKMSHKKAWDEIARVMNVKGYDVSGKQCMTRINTMKRTYKTVKDHNGRSGNNKRTWKYYDAMESLLGRKPYMEPLTTISSSGSVTSRPERPDSRGSSSSSVSTCESGEAPRKRKATDQPAIIQTLIEKRQKAEEEKAKRHKERMEMGNKMLAKLDKLLEKK
ncbi:uncharacterized protein LOC143905644 isoform X4 [Temnothorax americanus]|uniref:uncharacterized protein LOC143905644 isoform X4 n=1 Tax=Temnothorax americanus TaxID=1964332 RepID=UPI0040676A05